MSGCSTRRWRSSMPGATARRFWCWVRPARWTPRSGGRGSTGSTPRATRARSCAATRNGTISPPRPPPRARRSSAPPGPVYVNLDAEMQEMKLAEPLAAIDVARFMPPAAPAAAPELIDQAAAMLEAAKHPLMVVGRVSRSLEGWNARIALAEVLNAKVTTDLKLGCGFPTDHPRHAGAPASNALVPEAIAALKQADVILGLDCVDLNGVLRGAFGFDVSHAKIISVSADFHVHNGWSMDYEALPPVDLLLPTTPDDAVPRLLAALGATPSRKPSAAITPKPATYEPSDGPLRVDDLARALRAAVGERAVTLTHLPLSWNGAAWPFRHPLDYLGSEGGGGVGGGPGNSVGAALALKGSGRLPIAICGDGDFFMGVTAIWPAVTPMKKSPSP